MCSERIFQTKCDYLNNRVAEELLLLSSVTLERFLICCHFCRVCGTLGELGVPPLASHQPGCGLLGVNTASVYLRSKGFLFLWSAQSQALSHPIAAWLGLLKPDQRAHFPVPLSENAFAFLCRHFALHLFTFGKGMKRRWLQCFYV